MTCCTPTQPTQAGFLDFIRNIMGVPAAALPDDSPYIGLAFCLALPEVNTALCLFPIIYQQMVYNLAGDTIINIAQDVIIPPATKPYSYPNSKNTPYFQYLRQTWNINGFVSGVVQSTSDESTSTSLLVPEALSGLMLGDLQNLKTPWGRAYLAFAQKYGPSIWGIS